MYRYAAVAAKRASAARLATAFAAHPLVDWTSFSSIAALLGSAGQIAYSAANASLDAFAAKLSFAGAPARSVQWGPWGGGGGMAAADPALAARLAKRGLGYVTPEEGIRACESILRGEVTHCCTDCSAMSKSRPPSCIQAIACFKTFELLTRFCFYILVIPILFVFHFIAPTTSRVGGHRQLRRL